jgi:hypothetical protein
MVEVHAAKNDAGIGRRRQQADVSEDTRVKTHTFSVRLASYGGLKHFPSAKIACCRPRFPLFVHIFQ